MKTDFDIKKSAARAIEYFWHKKEQQLVSSRDTSNRGAVTGGKQMDGFIALIKEACVCAGVPEQYIYDRNNYIPGFFRSSKDWDIIIISPSGKLLAAIELKSQVGSYGNNFNNRAEEAIGSATDFWTAYREKEFSTYGSPWLGYMMVIGDDEKSNAPVKNYTSHFPVLPEFIEASYIARYEILCSKLMMERLYTSTCLIKTSDKHIFSDVSEELSLERFIKSLQGYLIGCSDEFDR